MYEIKKQIYLDFTKNQKSALCNFLRALVKKSQDLSIEDIWASFVADEKVDEYSAELGIRTFKVKGHQFLLNNQPIFPLSAITLHKFYITMGQSRSRAK